MTGPPAIGTVAGVMSRLVAWWRSVPTLAADTLLAAVVLVVSLVEVDANEGFDDTGSSWWRTALLIGMAVVLVFRRRAPIAVWLASGVMVAVYGVGTFPDPTLPYGPLISVYTVAAHCSARTAVVTGSISIGVVIGSLIVDPHEDALDWIIALLSVTTAWLLGNNVRTQRAYAEEMTARADDLERGRRADADRAVAEERVRIARELHDVAAHHVSVIALHAEAGQAVLPHDPASAERSLVTIGVVARTTLAELRGVVGVLRVDAAAPRAPQPGLSALPTLVDEVARAGLPVTLTIAGSPRPIGEHVDASAYRIVQEALTNVLRHAGEATAQVTVTYGQGAVCLDVVDDGVAGPDGSEGHGVIGMRERAAAFGGTLTAAPRPDGGFAVHATLPC
jgi:signal transduction histidine kinase